MPEKERVETRTLIKRNGEVSLRQADGDDDKPKRLDIVIATGEPVRVWGADEVLSMKRDAVDLSRLRNDAPFLLDHNNSVESIIGRIEKPAVKDKQLRAEVVLADTPKADEYRALLEQGMTSKISVGFRVEQWERTREATEEEVSEYTATRWTPLEASAVAVPADDGARVTGVRVQRLTEESTMADETKPAEDQASAATPTSGDPKVDREAVIVAERKRVADLTAYGEQFERIGGVDMARETAANGGTLDDLKSAIWEKREAEYRKQAEINKANGHESGATGDGRETFGDQDIKGFSLMRAINGLVQLRDGKQFNSPELEMMTATNKRIIEHNVRPTVSSGHTLPTEVLRTRDLQAGTGAGDNLVANNLLPSAFIEFLRPNSVLAGMTTMLGDQVGDVEIPKQTGTVNAIWRTEVDNTDSAVADQATDQVKLSPKELIIATRMTRKFLRQATPDGEMFVRNDLSAVAGLAMDYAGLIGRIGNALANAPQGVLSRIIGGDAALSSESDTADEWKWADVVDAEAEVNVANALMGSLAYIMNARSLGDMKTAIKGGDGSGRFVVEGGETNGHPVLVSNQILDNFGYAANKVTYTNAGTKKGFIFGNWRDVIMGSWYGVDVITNVYTGQLQNRVTISYHASADVEVRHIESFHAMAQQ